MNSNQFVCRSCGYVGSPKKVTKGSFFIEVILWFCFIVPGLIYTIWRLTTKPSVCPKCGNPTMIPSDTPVGKKIMGEHGNQPVVTPEAGVAKKPTLLPQFHLTKKQNIIAGVIAVLIIGVSLAFFNSVNNAMSSPGSSGASAPTPPSSSGLSIGDIGYAKSTNGSVVVLGTTQSNEDQLVKLAVANDTDGMAQMVLDGEAFYVDNGTKVRVIDESVLSKEVRILEGDHYGDSGWTPNEFITK